VIFVRSSPPGQVTIIDDPAILLGQILKVSLAQALEEVQQNAIQEMSLLSLLVVGTPTPHLI